MSNVPPPPPPPPPPGPPGGGWGRAPTPPPPYAPPTWGQPQAWGQAPPAAPPPPYGQPAYGYHDQPAAPQWHYAGFWQRFGAMFLDGLLGFVFALPAIALGIASFVAGEDALCRNFDDELATCRRPNGPLLALAFLVGAVGIVAFYVFLCRRLGGTGQTPGRKAMGVRVVDKVTGQPIGVGRAFGRYLFAGFISGQICYLGYLWMLWDGQKRTWHDMVVSSVVIRE